MQQSQQVATSVQDPEAVQSNSGINSTFSTSDTREFLLLPIPPWLRQRHAHLWSWSITFLLSFGTTIVSYEFQVSD